MGTAFGGANTETGQATCLGRANKKDRSFVEIHRSLVDGEVWAFVHDTEWEIQGPDLGSLRWNFFSGQKDGLIAGANFDYVLKDKNTILILQIEPKKFSEALWNARYFTVSGRILTFKDVAGNNERVYLMLNDDRFKALESSAVLMLAGESPEHLAEMPISRVQDTDHIFSLTLKPLCGSTRSRSA